MVLSFKNLSVSLKITDFLMIAKVEVIIFLFIPILKLQLIYSRRKMVKLKPTKLGKR